MLQGAGGAGWMQENQEDFFGLEFEVELGLNGGYAGENQES
jgi:hypothetical protein